MGAETVLIRYDAGMVLLAVIFLFFIGAVIGSFINVLITRSIEGEDWIRGRSRCDSCKKEIAWYDNIPLLSYAILNGKCRYCRKPISIQHPAIEMLTGLLFVWWYAIGFAFFKLAQAPYSIIQPLFWLVVGILLLIIFLTDWLYQIIPDWANTCLAILALVYRFYLSVTGAMRWEDFWLAIVMGLALSGFLAGLYFLTKGRGMGLGDVKFAMGMGLLLGWPRGLIALFIAFILGALVGVIMILLGWKKMKERIAFGPFLVLGTAVSLVWGANLWLWYWGLIG